MDGLNKTFAQIVDLFKSLSPGARMTAALLLIVVVVSVAYLFRTQMSGPDGYLMGGEPFPASQLPAMEAAFNEAGLSQYTIDGNRVRVPRGQQAAYMGALADAGALPPDFGKFLERALANQTPFTSKSQREEAIKVAKQFELQLMLTKMRGIEQASVLYDEKKEAGFGQRMVSTASVSVKPVGNQSLEEGRVNNIRHSVASAFAGLKPENVSVTDLNGRTYSGGSGSDGVANAMEDAYMSRKKAYQEVWTKTIRDALSVIPGVVVSVDVLLKPETKYQQTKTELDLKGVVHHAQETSSTKTVEGGAIAGRAGFAAQQQGEANKAAVLSQSAGPRTNEENSQTETQTAIPTTVTESATHPLTPERVKVVVGVPSSYYESIWREKNPAEAGQPPKKPDGQALADIESKEIEKVTKAVVALLPQEGEGKSRYPDVVVNTYQHLTSEPLPMPGMSDKAMAWLGQYWTSLGMAGLALVSLGMLRSIVRAVPTTEPTSAEPRVPSTLSFVVGNEPEAEDTSAPSEQPKAKNRLRRRDASGPSLREELSYMVKEDPDTAVAVLRNWIGSGN